MVSVRRAAQRATGTALILLVLSRGLSHGLPLSSCSSAFCVITVLMLAISWRALSFPFSRVMVSWKSVPEQVAARGPDSTISDSGFSCSSFALL